MNLTPRGLSGRDIARLKWHDGLSWTEIYRRYPKYKPSAIRSAARKYKAQHPEEFPDTTSTTGSTFEEDGNYARAQATSAHINTLPALLAECGVDLTVWRVQKWGVGHKSWEMGAKLVESDLQFDEGKISGWKQDKGLGKLPLEGWSIWANFIRIKPLPLYPTIQPVACTVTFRAPPVPKAGGLCRALVFADPHVGFLKDTRNAKLEPFHDRRALDLVLQLASAVQPDRIDCLGDLLDFAEWTDRFLRSPEFYATTQPSILEAHWWLRQLRRSCPDAAISLHEGNHEGRMNKQVLTHLRAASDLRPADEMDLPPALTPQRLLALHKLGIEWHGDYPDDEHWLGQGLKLAHGDIARGEPGATTAAIIKKAYTSEIVGHIHRREMASRTIYEQGRARTITAYCPGCVCRIDGIVPGTRSKQQWQQGLAIVEYNPAGDQVSRYDIEISDGIALWGGKQYEGRDRVSDLPGDLPGWNW